MSRKIYQVWTEDKDGNETAVLFQGTKTAAKLFMRTYHGGEKLHLGYLL